MSKIKANPNCDLCQGGGIAHFVDMSKVPVYTRMKMGDKIWKKYEESCICPDCFPDNFSEN